MDNILTIVKDLPIEKKIESGLVAVKMIFHLVKDHQLNKDGYFSNVIELFDEFLQTNKSAVEYEPDPEDFFDEFIYSTSNDIYFDIFISENDDVAAKRAKCGILALKTIYDLCLAVYMEKEFYFLEEETNLTDKQKQDKQESPSLETVIMFAGLAGANGLSSMEDVERVHLGNLEKDEQEQVFKFIEEWASEIEKLK